jgi:excinuclease ABC subunit C
MLDAKGRVIYVGKAKNLKKRVSSYFQRQLDNKTIQLVQQIDSIQVTITRNEREALLLESNLIKELRPRYNVIFKDDKSYPYLYFSIREQYPRFSFHRGEKKGHGKYYGPYPSSRLAREALNFLQRIFKLRQCDDSFFKSRTRPCLQYQIKRCSAPCINLISQDLYKKDVDNALLFLEGRSQTVISQLITQMEEASEELEYERAAQLRDQIALLRGVQEQQIIINKETSDIDVLGLAVEGHLCCIHVLMIREGRMMGTRHYFPSTQAVLLAESESSVQQMLLEAFIGQHYCTHADNSDLPREILIPIDIAERVTLEDFLTERGGRQLRLSIPSRGVRLQWLQMATVSAQAALKGRVHNKNDLTSRFEALQEALHLEAIPQRLECFDVSHTFGTATVASCVVFDSNGPYKAAYRRFNIRGVKAGDDYGALRQALTRHYTRLKSEGEILPDILFIDGGKGQLSTAEAVLDELQVTGVVLMGVAKGPTRKAGLETLYLSSKGQILSLAEDSPALHLIQQIRDEAHRFAITAHRQQRTKRGLHSRLEDIAGIGKQRRLALLKQFGGLQEVLQASREELGKVPGINKALAERIYTSLHGE